MTYQQSPVAQFFAASGASPSGGTSVLATTAGLTQQSLVFLFIGGLGTLSTGVSVSVVGGTWTRIASVTGTGVSSEIWVGYGFNSSADGTSKNIFVTWAASTKASYAVLRCEMPVPVTSAPTTAASTGTGNSTTPDPGTVTPAVGDIVVATACWANTTTASGTTDTPGAEQQFATIPGVAATATRSIHAGRTLVTSTTATKRTWTITSAQWSAVIAKVTLPSLTEGTSLVLKGTDTAAADAASSF